MPQGGAQASRFGEAFGECGMFLNLPFIMVVLSTDLHIQVEWRSYNVTIAGK